MVGLDSPELLAYVVHALRLHAQLYRRNGMAEPAGVGELVSFLSSGVSGGQRGSARAPRPASEQVGAVAPLLVSYEAAAEMLSVSVSTLKRRIAAGELHPVQVGGVVRLRVSDLNEYVAALVAQKG